MTDPYQSNNPAPDEDLAGEFRNLGNNLRDIVQNIWESAERKKLQQEIEAGLDELGKSLSQTLTEIKDSPAGQQFKDEARDLHDRVRSGEVETKVRSELFSILQQVNAELQKVVSPKPDSSQASSKED